MNNYSTIAFLITSECLPGSKPDFICDTSKTLSVIKHPNPVAVFIAAYYSVGRGSHALMEFWQIEYARFTHLETIISGNIPAAQRTLSLIITSGIVQDLNDSQLISDPLQNCLLMHKNESWVHAYCYRNKIDSMHAEHVRVVLDKDMALYCHLLSKIETFTNQWSKKFCSLVDTSNEKWAIAFLHPEFDKVFRAMGWYPKQVQIRTMMNLHSKGFTPNPNGIELTRRHIPF